MYKTSSLDIEYVEICDVLRRVYCVLESKLGQDLLYNLGTLFIWNEDRLINKTVFVLSLFWQGTKEKASNFYKNGIYIVYLVIGSRYSTVLCAPLVLLIYLADHQFSPPNYQLAAAVSCLFVWSFHAFPSMYMSYPYDWANALFFQ